MRHLLAVGKRNAIEQTIEYVATIVNIYIENDNLQGALFLRKAVHKAKMQKEAPLKDLDLIDTTHH